jgi:tetratricopeptide (TPR) repeat protein
MICEQSASEADARASGQAQRWRVPAVCLALAAITFAVFVQTTGFEFVNYNDKSQVCDNPMVAQGLTLKGIVWAFTGAHAFNWRPLTWLSHELDCQIYGLNPGGHHLTNVLIHTATVIALFLILRQMTGAFWRSAFVAAVFAIHPLRVESVAWVADRKDVFSGLFFMLTIGAYARYVENLKFQISNFKFFYIASVVLFAMGLMCNPMLVTLPLVLLLLDYWPLQRVESARRLVMEKLPLLALSAASCVVALLARSGAIEENAPLPLPLRVANALASCMVYLGQMVYPAGLAVFYPHPKIGLPLWEVALAGTLLAGLSAVAVWQRRKQPWILAGWLWYLVMLLPVAGIIPVGSQAHADRYTYLPQIGVYLAVTWWVAHWPVNRRPRPHSRRRSVTWPVAQWWANRVALVALMTVVVGALMVCAWKQTAYWQDSETLWNRALACTTDNLVAHLRLGADLDQNGSLDEAMVHYREALKISPGNVGAHNNLGNDLRQTGRLDEAISQYQEALQSDPDYADARINLGTALLQAGRLDEAIPHLQKALQLNPGYAKAHNNLGNAFLQKGNEAEAIPHFQRALELEPADPWPKNNLAWILATCPEASLRDGKKAVELASQANALTRGGNLTILHTLAAAFAEAGRFSEAVETAQRALYLAEAQSNATLAGKLQYKLKLFQAGKPFHRPPRTH